MWYLSYFLKVPNLVGPVKAKIELTFLRSRMADGRETSVATMSAGQVRAHLLSLTQERSFTGSEPNSSSRCSGLGC